MVPLIFLSMKGEHDITMNRLGVKSGFNELNSVPSICATTNPGRRSFTRLFVSVDSSGCISWLSGVGANTFNVGPILICKKAKER